MQAEYVPAAVYLEFTFISTEELSFDPNHRQEAKLASMLIVQRRCVPVVRFSGSSRSGLSQLYAENYNLVGISEV